MTELHAGQLLYTRVESKFSPQRRSGYQTIFRSPSLPDEDVRRFEELVSVFKPEDPTARRLQFARLPSGRLLCTSSRPIETDTTFIDKEGRRGVFLAHGAVLTTGELRRVANHPFRVLDSFPFVETLGELVDDVLEGAPQEEVRFRSPKRRAAPLGDDWDGESKYALRVLARQAQTMCDEKRAALFSGDAESIAAALRQAIEFTEPEYRSHCTFDTHVKGRTPRPGSFWVLGSSEARSTAASMVLDVTSGRIGAALRKLPASNDPYSRWLEDAFRREDGSERLAKQMQAIERALAGGRWAAAEEVERAAVREFLEFHGERVESTLRSVFAQHVGAALATPVAEHALDSGTSDVAGKRLLRLMVQGGDDAAAVADHVCAWLDDGGAPIDERDWRPLARLARDTGHAPLRFRAAVCPRKKDVRSRDEALRKMDREAYARALDLLLERVGAEHFAVERHIGELLRPERLARIDDEEFLAVLTPILKRKGSVELGAHDACMDRIRRLEGADLKRLNKLSKKYAKNEPGRFHKVVEACIEERTDG